MTTKTISTTMKDVYETVYAYCKNKGYIKELRKSFTETEEKRFNKRKISKEGLDILDAVHCIEDKNRSMLLLLEISKKIRPGMSVLEAGVGTGILSLGAASKKAIVTGLELNSTIVKLTKNILASVSNRLGIRAGSINFLKANAITYKTSQKFDTIISENLYTGMFYEKQVQIMNHLASFLKKGGFAIPSGLRSGIVLVSTIFPHTPLGQELFVPLQLGKTIRIRALSESKIYSELNFSKKNPTHIKKKITFTARASGKVNSVLIWSEVLLPSKKIIGRKDTTFLNNDIVIALKHPRKVKKGEKVTLELEYSYGDKPSSAHIHIR